jgi:hypothetical protein
MLSLRAQNSLLYSESAPVEQRRFNKIELRAAAFLPASHRFKKIYGDLGTSLQLEAARGLKNCKYLEVWENLEWIFMHGKPIRSCGSTKIDIVNISLGLKTIGKVISNTVYLYVGLGVDFGVISLNNHMHCGPERLKQHKTSSAWGGIGKMGAQIFLRPGLYLNAFGDYLYLPVAYHRTVDVGGWKIGIGLGGNF